MSDYHCDHFLIECLLGADAIDFQHALRTLLHFKSWENQGAIDHGPWHLVYTLW